MPAAATSPIHRTSALRSSRSLNPPERADLVAFLKSLSDDRVRFERAPFYPEICIPIGYPDAASADPAFPLSAVDRAGWHSGSRTKRQPRSTPNPR
jgi:hypothetical protein